MARGSRSSRTPSARTSRTANDPLASLLGGSISEPDWRRNLDDMQRQNDLLDAAGYSYDRGIVRDGRYWNPDPDPSPVTVTGNRTWSVVRVPKLIVHKRSPIARNYYTNLPVGLQVPIGVKRAGLFPVLTCVRRKIRKAVMFATGRRHKGSGAGRRRRGEQSKVGC